MTNLIDYILDLFRSPAVAANFVADPEGALRSVGLQNVSAAQFAAVAASAAPAGVLLGGGDPVYGLQHAVADYHSIPAAVLAADGVRAADRPREQQRHPARQQQRHLAAQPRPARRLQRPAGRVQPRLRRHHPRRQDHHTPPPTAASCTGSAGHIDTTIVNGDGTVVGDGNSANNGYIDGGSHSPIIIGEGNDTKVTDTSQHSGGDIITGNEGTVIKDNDMSRRHTAAAPGASGGPAVAACSASASATVATRPMPATAAAAVDHRQRHVVALHQLDRGRQPDHRRRRPGQRQPHRQLGQHATSPPRPRPDTDNTSTTTSDDHSFTSNVASGNSTDIASHNDTDLASHNDTHLGF